MWRALRARLGSRVYLMRESGLPAMDQAGTEAPVSAGVKRWLPLALLVTAGVEPPGTAVPGVASVDRSWPIEVTLANREKLTYRVLLGRQAIRSNMLIDPEASFRQPKLSYTLYSRS